MTDYTEPTDVQLAVDSPVRSIDMRNIRDLARAMSEGATGAPRMLKASYGDGEMGYTGLDIVDGSASGSISADTATSVGISPADYAFLPTFTSTNGSTSVLGSHSVTFTANAQGADYTYTIDWKYIDA